MRPQLVLLLATGCTDLTVSAPLDTPQPNLEGMERTEVVELGVARLAPNGPVLWSEDEAPEHSLSSRLSDLPVVDADLDIQVYVELAQIDLLVYLERTDLASRVVESVRTPRVQIEPGVAIDVLAEDDQEVLIEVGDRDIWAEAWVPTEAIDQVWQDATFSDTEDAINPIWLRGQTEILDAPGGTAFAWVDAFTRGGPASPEVFWLRAEALGEPRDGVTEIRVARPGFQIHGFVAVQDLARSPNGGRGFGQSSSSDCGLSLSAESEEVTVPAGTDLFVAPEGLWVGRTHAPIYREIEPDLGSDWGSLEVTTPWGVATVWLDMTPSE